MRIIMPLGAASGFGVEFGVGCGSELSEFGAGGRR